VLKKAETSGGEFLIPLGNGRENTPFERPRGTKLQRKGLANRLREKKLVLRLFGGGICFSIKFEKQKPEEKEMREWL